MKNIEQKSLYDNYAPRTKVIPSPRAETDAIIVGLLPWLMFTLTVGLFTFAFQDFEPIVWGLAASSALLALLLMAIGFNARPVQMTIGCFLLLSLGAAVLIGRCIESRFMHDYWRIERGASYHNVRPQAPSLSYLDATVLEFNEMTYVDVSRSIGFMQGGNFLCVAPIYSANMTSSPEFWAVGINCCEPRGDFACIDSDEMRSKRGLVVERSSTFTKAIRMAQSVHGLGDLRGQGIAMHWIANPNSAKQSLWSSAVTLVTITAAIHLLIASMVGCVFGRQFTMK